MSNMNFLLKRKSINILLLCIILIFLVIDLFPFYWVFIASLQSNIEILTGRTKLFPSNMTIANYSELLFETTGITAFRHYILNSLKVSLSVALLTIFISVLGAYSLTHFNFYGKDIIGKMLLFVYVFPTIVIIVPAYGLMAKFHLVDTHLSLILMHTTLAAPFCTWLLRPFFESVPKELEEAAEIDGSSKFKTFLHILLPLSLPGILTVGIYALITSWGEYLFSLVLIDSGTKKTVPLALSAYMSHVDIQWGRLLAGCILNVIPILLIFLPLVKYFMKGLMEGALKE
ncbi:Inner membrane ABC transporter permease protein YcjP [subsurface metagenome]